MKKKEQNKNVFLFFCHVYNFEERESSWDGGGEDMGVEMEGGG